MADDDFSGYAPGQLEENERRRVRRDFQRVDALWATFGPIAQAAKSWKAWAAIIAVLVWINSPQVVEALRLMAGVGQ